VTSEAALPLLPSLVRSFKARRHGGDDSKPTTTVGSVAESWKSFEALGMAGSYLTLVQFREMATPPSVVMFSLSPLIDYFQVPTFVPHKMPSISVFIRPWSKRTYLPLVVFSRASSRSVVSRLLFAP
jgi:hypothetical protein